MHLPAEPIHQEAQDSQLSCARPVSPATARELRGVLEAAAAARGGRSGDLAAATAALEAEVAAAAAAAPETSDLPAAKEARLIARPESRRSAPGFSLEFACVYSRHPVSSPPLLRPHRHNIRFGT